MSTFRPLLGGENFAEIRKGNFCYVDKTGFLSDFLDPLPAKVSLFTRSRRFGKTLFLSMLASFFDITKDSGKLFEGLKVAANAKLCEDWMNRYPVVFLTMKDVDRPDCTRAVRCIHSLISQYCSGHEYLLTSERVKDADKRFLRRCLSDEVDEDTLSHSLQVLTRALSDHYGRKTVVLIDEYDVPLAKAQENSYYDDMVQFMRWFLSEGLGANPSLKMAVLTGCLRVSQESIFSGINFVDCYDVATPAFADVFGFTQAEVDQLLVEAGCEEKADVIREWYCGYRFGTSYGMYCPWSILSYLRDTCRFNDDRPKPYWVNTSGNELTKGFDGRIPASIQESMIRLMEGKHVSAVISSELNYNKIYNRTDYFLTLLYFTGYLTEKQTDDKNELQEKLNLTNLSIPNKEVKVSFENEISSWFADIMPEGMVFYEFLNSFWNGDVERLTNLLNERMISSASLHEYQYSESFYRALLRGIFQLRYVTLSNGDGGVGRGVLTVFDDNEQRVALIEVKAADSEETMEKTVSDALAQVEQQYDAGYGLKEYREILHWGMAFHKKSCRMGVRRVKR